MVVGEVSVQQFPGLRVLVRQGTIDRAEIGAFLGDAFVAAGSAIEQAGSHPAGGPVARYDMADDRFTVQAGFPIGGDLPAPEGLEVDEFPAGPIATLTFQGPYDQIPMAYQQLSTWMHEHGYRPDGRPWEQYLDGPEVPDPRTVVCWPCAKAEPAAH